MEGGTAEEENAIYKDFPIDVDIHIAAVLCKLRIEESRDAGLPQEKG